MNDGRGKQLPMCPENKISVQDDGRLASPFPRPLSEYFSPDVSSRLINSGAPRTLATIDQEILSIKAIIESLHVLRILKSQARNECAPISRLPPEILAEIFMTCVGHANNEDIPAPYNLDIRLVLGQVCSAWRSVAWGLPMLWTTVHCRVLHPNKSKKLAGLLFQWLLRAQDLSVRVKIDFCDEEVWAKLGMDSPIDILNALTPFYDQVKALDLVLPASWACQLRAANYMSFRSLEELRIRPPAPVEYHEIDIDAFSPSNIDAFNSPSPKLRSVSYESYLLQHLYLPWTNLTSAEFGGPSLDEIVELLFRCTDLTTCRIFNPTPDNQIYPISPISHRRLQHLYIGFRELGQTLPEEVSCSEILSFLTAPLLRSISLELSEDHISPLPDILQLIERSQCPLKDVEVVGLMISEDQVVEFLSESTVAHLHNG